MKPNDRRRFERRYIRQIVMRGKLMRTIKAMQALDAKPGAVLQQARGLAEALAVYLEPVGTTTEN